MDFYNKHKIKVMLNKSLVGKAPPEWGQENWRNYYRNFKPVEMTPREFAAMVFVGYSFTPIYANGRRIEGNFAEAWHMAFDFDEGGASLDYLFRPESFAWYFASFGYSTPSSTPENPRSRVVFVFDSPITDSGYFRKLYAAMARRFEREGSQTDPQCKDPLRLYYGSPKATMVGNWAVLSTLEGSSGMSTADVIIQQNPELPVVTVTHPFKQAVVDGDMSGMLARLADNIATAQSGSKHWARFSNARSAGGYIAAGTLEEGEAVRVLVDAALSNTDTPKTAERDVMEGIRAGKDAPIYKEVALSFGEVAD